MIAVGDLEADGLLPDTSRIWCGVFKDVETKEVYTFRPHEMEEMCKFLDGVTTLIMHNGFGFDWPALEQVLGYTYEGERVDTLVISRLQKPRRFSKEVPRSPHSVEAWGHRFGRYKPSHEDWSQFSEEMLHRCTEDVEIQFKIWEYLNKEADGYDWTNARRISMRVFDILAQQERQGWLVDQDHMEKCLHTLNHWMDRVSKALAPGLPWVREDLKEIRAPFKKSGDLSVNTLKWCEKSGMPPEHIKGPFNRIHYRRLNLESTAECKQLLLAEGWQPLAWNTDSDGKKTSPKLNKDDPFEGIQGARGRLLAKRFQCKHRRSQIEGFLRNIRPDGRVPQRISGLAATGRLTHNIIVNVPSSEAFFGPQMRRIFIARPGYHIVGTDSAGCQNRMLAARVGDDNFTKILLEGDKDLGTSIHQVNQRAIADIAGIDVTYKTCKNLNYAFMFGATDPKLGKMVNMNKEAGGRIREALLSISPGFKDLVDSLTDQWYRNGGWIEGVDGRPIFIEAEHTLLVYMLQSDEAIMMQYALAFLDKWCKQRDWRWDLDYAFVANNHDEFQSEVRDEIVVPFADLSAKSITRAGEYLNIACKHEGESMIGYSWADSH